MLALLWAGSVILSAFLGYAVGWYYKTRVRTNDDSPKILRARIQDYEFRWCKMRDRISELEENNRRLTQATKQMAEALERELNRRTNP